MSCIAQEAGACGPVRPTNMPYPDGDGESECERIRHLRPPATAAHPPAASTVTLLRPPPSHRAFARDGHVQRPPHHRYGQPHLPLRALRADRVRHGRSAAARPVTRSSVRACVRGSGRQRFGALLSLAPTVPRRERPVLRVLSGVRAWLGAAAVRRAYLALTARRSPPSPQSYRPTLKNQDRFDLRKVRRAPPPPLLRRARSPPPRRAASNSIHPAAFFRTEAYPAAPSTSRLARPPPNRWRRAYEVRRPPLPSQSPPRPLYLYYVVLLEPLLVRRVRRPWTLSIVRPSLCRQSAAGVRG